MNIHCGIWSFHNEYCCLLGCDVTQLARGITVFWRNLFYCEAGDSMVLPNVGRYVSQYT